MPARHLARLLDDPLRLVEWPESRVRRVIDSAMKLLVPQPTLIRVGGGRVVFVGDTHGDFTATAAAGRMLLEGKTRYLVFLGDYVDRGERPVVNILLALLLKMRRPKRVFLLRGNHETLEVNSHLGFLKVISERYSPELHGRFNELFAQLSLALVTPGGIIAVHGGLPEFLADISRLESMPKGWTDDGYQIQEELLWNDPMEDEGGTGFMPNRDREAYKLFGRDVFDRFMDRNGLRLMIRSHQCFPDGYRYHFGGRLLTVFSKPGYYRGNKGAIVRVDGGVCLNAGMGGKVSADGSAAEPSGPPCEEVGSDAGVATENTREESHGGRPPGIEIIRI